MDKQQSKRFSTFLDTLKDVKSNKPDAYMGFVLVTEILNRLMLSARTLASFDDLLMEKAIIPALKPQPFGDELIDQVRAMSSQAREFMRLVNTHGEMCGITRDEADVMMGKVDDIVAGKESSDEPV